MGPYEGFPFVSWRGWGRLEPPPASFPPGPGPLSQFVLASFQALPLSRRVTLDRSLNLLESRLPPL